MEINGSPRRLARSLALGAVMLSAMMLVSVLVSAPAAEASAFSDSPCPAYSIQDVFDDLSGNWDGDQVNNSDELYNGLNPCVVDTGQFCAGGDNALCTYYTYLVVNTSAACQQSAIAFPSRDNDLDGVRNDAEIRYGANPCAHPCPHYTSVDVSLNPNGSWDNDGVSNSVEVRQGTNPCSGVTYIPCPTYTLAQVNAMATFDWDGDGIANATEVRQGTNPCAFNTVQRLQHQVIIQQPITRLPHVTTTPAPVYVAPVPVTPTCPYGYPYYHPGNGLCYANPIGRFYNY